ncbi:hypothetical protein [Bacillus cereus]|uniref:hypothetical protein n=1 Tax=Bacillus cereus TaxID=1396 RepID=UPI0015CF43DB|nr:hypothetical protein [Bacillus cereus]
MEKNHKIILSVLGLAMIYSLSNKKQPDIKGIINSRRKGKTKKEYVEIQRKP